MLVVEGEGCWVSGVARAVVARSASKRVEYMVGVMGRIFELVCRFVGL